MRHAQLSFAVLCLSNLQKDAKRSTGVLLKQAMAWLAYSQRDVKKKTYCELCNYKHISLSAIQCHLLEKLLMRFSRAELGGPTILSNRDWSSARSSKLLDNLELSSDMDTVKSIAWVHIHAFAYECDYTHSHAKPAMR